ncbi:hypothetical protein ACYSNR_00900 [Enterococcus sp. LJL128]
MAKCRNDVLINKIGLKALTKLMEVDFAVLTDIDSCVRVNTKNYIDYQGTTATYNGYSTPDDMFNCLAEGCKTTGTLMVTNGAGLTSGATFSVLADATDFVAGVITYYVHFPTAGEYTLKTTISDITNQNMTNADIYSQVVTVQSEGFFPVVVDLSKVPTSQEGTGWDASESGVLIKLEATPVDDTVIPNIGFSTIFVYDSIEDFEVNDVVKLSCLDEFSGDFTVSPRDASCFGASYDPTSITIERTITGKMATPNYWKLNPLNSRGDLTTGWIPQTVEKEVTAITIDGNDYGYVQLADMNMDECSFTLATMADNCNVTDSMLNRVSSPVIVSVNEKQFIVLDGTTTTMVDAGKLIFHSSLVGQKVIISYPKKVDAEHYVGNENALEQRRVRMSFVNEQTDGVKLNYIYNNVLVTSFPASITNEEPSFNFTISVQRDRNGDFYEMFRVIE